MLMLLFDFSWPWTLQHADQIPKSKLCCEEDDEGCITYCYGEAPHNAAALQHETIPPLCLQRQLTSHAPTATAFLVWQYPSDQSLLDAVLDNGQLICEGVPPGDYAVKPATEKHVHVSAVHFGAGRQLSFWVQRDLHPALMLS